MDIYIDRDWELNKIRSEKKIKLIMNGWFMKRPKNWPPSPSIEPLFVSFHISPRVASEMTAPRSIEYLKQHEPIGTRDTFTRDVLRKHGVRAYFSGCLSLTLNYDGKFAQKKRSDNILLVDLPDIIIKNLPADLLIKSKIITHKIYSPLFDPFYTFLKKRVSSVYESYKKYEKFRRLVSNSLASLDHRIWRRRSKRDYRKSFDMAERLLREYARAKVVVTSRLHCALPCLALNTPVVFVYHNLKDPRARDYIQYLNAYTWGEFLEKVHEIDWDNLRNPRDITDIRQNLIKRVINFIEES